MKKTIITITMVAVLLVISTFPAFAGKWVDAQKADFYTVTGGSSDNVTGVLAGGQVNIVDPMGNVSLIIQGNVVGLTPYTSYAVWVRNLTGYTGTSLNSYTPLGYYHLVNFTTDEFGNGSFHINLRADDLPDGTYEIQVAVNTQPSGSEINGHTLVATPKYMIVTVKTQ